MMVSKRVSGIWIRVLCVVAWVFPGLAWAQNTVALPQGMPNMPPGVSPYGVRRVGPSSRRVRGKQPSRRDRQGTASSGPSSTFEISGNTPFGVPRFAVVGALKPRYYTVRTGDTLWDISATYFQDPWYWPKLWALNPSITNPHWIYPGDRIRFRKGAVAKKKAPSRKAPKKFGVIKNAIYSPTGAVSLRQKGYLEEEKIKKAGVIKGAFHEKIMLATYDIIYIKVNPKRPLKAGERYTIFKPIKKVKKPGKKKTLGRIVKIYADVEIKSVKWKIYKKKGKTKKKGIAKGVILRAVNPVERGYLVGKLVRRYRSVKPIKNTTLKDVKGVVLDVLGRNQVIGTRKLVFINRGSRHKIKKGHVFFVVRKGDAYRKTMEKRYKEKKAQSYWPKERVAALVVVDVGKNHCTAIVRESLFELRVGEKVELQYSGANSAGRS